GVPLSFEWSVPFQASLFHVGVRGIAPASFDETVGALTAYTGGPASHRLEELLDWLVECRETFIVLNHPYWDMAGVGQLRHDSALLAFLRAYRDRIHGLELN